MGWLATRRDAGTYPRESWKTPIQQTSPIASDRLWVVVGHRHHYITVSGGKLGE